MIQTGQVTFAPPFFPKPRLSNCCAECGARIIDANGRTVEEQDLGYHRVHFDLSDGTQAFVSFCGACVGKPWTETRLQALEEQCKFGWNRMATPGVRKGWSGDHLTFRPATRPWQSWSEVQ